MGVGIDKDPGNAKTFIPESNGSIGPERQSRISRLELCGRQ